MAIPVHGDLKARMACERLHCLGRQTSFDPARNREVPEGVPVEFLGRFVAPFVPFAFEAVEERLLFSFHHAVVVPVAALEV